MFSGESRGERSGECSEQVQGMQRVQRSEQAVAQCEREREQSADKLERRHPSKSSS